MIVLRVSKETDVKVLAGAIERNVHKHGSIEVHAIGEKAVNKAVKAIAIANDFIKCRNVVLIATPYFQTVKGQNADGTSKSLSLSNFVVGKER